MICACEIIRTNRDNGEILSGDGWYCIKRCPLHAAAPELLEVLEEFTRLFDKLCIARPEQKKEMQPWQRRVRKQTLATIAKAKNE